MLDRRDIFIRIEGCLKIKIFIFNTFSLNDYNIVFLSMDAPKGDDEWGGWCKLARETKEEKRGTSGFSGDAFSRPAFSPPNEISTATLGCRENPFNGA